MPAPYSLDLRQKAVAAYENGEGTQEEISTRFSIGLRTLQEWLVLKSMTGDLEPKEHIYRGKKPIIDEKGLAFIQKLITKKPDILIDEIRRLYQKRFDKTVVQSMVSRAFKKLNLRRKKKSEYAQEQEREDVKKNGKIGKKQ